MKKNNNIFISVLMLIILTIIVFSVTLVQGLYPLSVLSIFPVFILGLEYGIFSSLAVSIIFPILLGFMGDMQGSVFLFLNYLLPTTLVIGIINLENKYIGGLGKFSGVIINNRFATIRVILVSILIFFFMSFIYYFVLKEAFGFDIVSNWKIQIESVVKTLKSNMSSTELGYLEKSGTLESIMDADIVYSVFAFLKSTFVSMILYFIGLPIYSRLYSKKIVHIEVDRIFLPGNPVIVLFISLLILFFIGRVYEVVRVDSIINGYVSVMSILFFIEAISLVIYVLKRWNRIKRRVNWIILTLVVVFMGVFPGISLIGMLDNLINFRKRWDLEDNNNGGDYEL